jgi:hypothetical protein
MAVSAIARQRQKVEDQTKRPTPVGRCLGSLSPSRFKMMGTAFPGTDPENDAEVFTPI